MTHTHDPAAALRAHARGLHCAEATAELLIGHAAWLRRDDFLHVFVHAAPAPPGADPTAAVDWPAAIAALDRGALPCSGGEARVLRLAASLAAGVPVDLRDALTGLDVRNAALVRDAVTRATGHR